MSPCVLMGEAVCKTAGVGLNPTGLSILLKAHRRWNLLCVFGVL